MASSSSEMATTRRHLFVGDGLYPGDGGAELERIYNLHGWKPLNGCDGRFVHRGAALAALSLQELCKTWSVVACTPVIRCCEAADNLDAAECVRFKGGGGLLTYIKSDGVTFVHTLNTESGLARKLHATRGDAHLQVVRALGNSAATPLFAALCELIGRVPEPDRTRAAPALSVAFRGVLARGAYRADLCVGCDEPPSSRPSRKRSVDWLLEGTSIQTNKHLSRFANAPYLPYLLSEPAFSPMLSRTSKSLKKEIIEAYVLIEALEGVMELPTRTRPAAAASAVVEDDEVVAVKRPTPSAVVDLCSGKGFLSILLALECPSLTILAVDLNKSIKSEHFDLMPNLTFLRADIMKESFVDVLHTALDGHGTSCVALGMHLCGLLSPRAIQLFEAIPCLTSLLLVPCCLDKRTDGPLKMQAKLEGISPYEAKVSQLQSLLLDSGGGVEVTVTRPSAMRTTDGTEGGDACKNAIIVGCKPQQPTPQPSAGGGSSSSQNNEPSWSLEQLSAELLCILGNELINPIWPKWHVALASCCKGMREALREQSTELFEVHRDGLRVALRADHSQADSYDTFAHAFKEWYPDVGRVTNPLLLMCSTRELHLQGTHILDDDCERLERFVAGYNRMFDSRIGRDQIWRIEDNPQYREFWCSPNLSRLCRLDLNDNMICDGGIKALARMWAAGATPDLLHLDLSYNNHFGDVGCVALAEAFTSSPTHTVLPHLMTLTIWRNQIGDVGIRALAHLLKPATETNQSNPWIIDFLRPLPISLSLPSLEMIDAQYNPNGMEAAAELRAACSSRPRRTQTKVSSGVF